MSTGCAIVIGPPPYRIKDGIIEFLGDIGPSDSEMRRMCLYFDHLIAVDVEAPGLHVGFTEDAKTFYLEAGIISQHLPVQFYRPGDDSIVDIKAWIAEKFNKHNAPYIRFLSAGEDAPRSLGHDVQENPETILTLALLNTLPIPSNECEWPDILEFKASRYDEIHALRSAMDEMYLRIIDSKDIPRATDHCVDELKFAIRDLQQVYAESGLRQQYRSAVKVKLNLGQLITGAVGGMAIGTQIGLSPEVGSLIGASMGAAMHLEFEPKAASVPDRLGPYRYICEAERKFGGAKA